VILEKFFKDTPVLKEKVDKAPGYATFSTFNMNLLLLATQRGSGVIVNRKTNKIIYMKIVSIGGGIGAGIKDLGTLIIFNKQETMDQFINSGWQFNASADAALKSGEKGEELGKTGSVAIPTENGELTLMEIYVITEADVSAQATIAGTKFYKNEELN